MCGIVCYFGSAGNGLTRILSGMSAIIYRAPDSTGIGLFGDDFEPVKTKKALGALPQLLESIFAKEIFSNRSREWLGIFLPLSTAECAGEIQQRVLQYEGFSATESDRGPDSAHRTPSIDRLLGSGEDSRAASIGPGTAGALNHPRTFRVQDRRSLVSLIGTLIDEYDLAPVASKSIIRYALKKEGETAIAEGRIHSSLDQVLEAFEEVFEEVLFRDLFGGEKTTKRFWPPALSRQVKKELWRLLIRTPVRIPLDFERDGVRWVLRTLAAAVNCRRCRHIHIDDAIQAHFNRLWLCAPHPAQASWRETFAAERAANVYGWAAAAALTFIRENELRERIQLGGAPQAGIESLASGRTDPISLQYLATPIIAHGRWALQSANTVENAHPFTDRSEERAIVLNGQFNGVTEATLLDYLKNASIAVRTGNSAEYLPLLWEHYFQTLAHEKLRYEMIFREMDAGLEAVYVGSQAIDYRVHKQIHGQSLDQLDELAFVQAVGKIVADGGQAAIAAIDARNPACFYVVSHHRPVFVVQRPDNGDVMAVSDVNAALGLFSQREIWAKSRELIAHEKERKELLASLDSAESNVPEARERAEGQLARKLASILEPFTVRVFPLEGESTLARITTVEEAGKVTRRVDISDFAKSSLPDIEPLEVVINPLQTRRDLHKSFYDAHLEEIPQRLRELFAALWPRPDRFLFTQLKERNVHRRFGANLESLKRIVFVGMGSSYHMGLLSRPYVRSILPRLQCDVLRPTEIDEAARCFDFHRDLIVLLSVSGTSADVVEFANEVNQQHGIMIAVTEKPFSDMALATAKTGGVIPILAGEEVTYSGIKSTVCMAAVCRLLTLWLAQKSRLPHAPSADLEELHALPGLFERVLGDVKIREMSRTIGEKSASSYAAVVLDDLSWIATGREVASKLEETGCTALGKALDYRDLTLAPLAKSLEQNLVLVNATGSRRLPEAIESMKWLYAAGIEFAAVTYEHSHLDEIRFFSRGLSVVLPKVQDAHQPIIDLAFYYQLARDFGLAHRCAEPGFPRNRAKSVTVAAQRSAKRPSLREEFKALERYQTAALPAAPDAATLWEERAKNSYEKNKYESLRRLSFALRREEPLRFLLRELPGRSHQAFAALGELLAGGGAISLVAADRSSLAAALDAAKAWRGLSKCSMEVATLDSAPKSLDSEACAVFLGAAVPHDLTPLAEALADQERALWIGCSLPAHLREPFDRSLGCFEMNRCWEELPGETLYAILSRLFIEGLKVHRPEHGRFAAMTLGLAPYMVTTILHDRELHEQIERAVRQNRAYRTAVFIGPHSGVGARWTERFDEAGGWLVQNYMYGESGHGPVVTVDASPARKYVSERSREELLQRYGGEWEKQAFEIDGRHYLPMLKPEYEAARDNLIFLDASSERDLSLALAELSLYGYRFARLVIITQEAYRSLPQFKEFLRYPIDHIIALPSLAPEGSSRPIPELLLPFAMSLVASAFAAKAALSKRHAPRPSGPEAVMEYAFGTVGCTLAELEAGLHSLNHRVIESIMNIAPLVKAVTGTAAYQVRRIETEMELRDLMASTDVYASDQVPQNFAKAEASQTPYYLVHPEKQLFKGRARALAEKTFADDYWHQWFEVYGVSWRCLVHERLELDEGFDGRPRLQLPLVDAGSNLCRLLHLYIECREWNPSLPLNDQIHETVTALGKYRAAQDAVRAKYERITSQFYHEVIPEGFVWADEFFAVVSRSFLIHKASKEVADLIVERVLELLKPAPAQCPSAAIESLISVLHKVWHHLPKGEDEQRWAALQQRVSAEYGSPKRAEPN